MGKEDHVMGGDREALWFRYRGPMDWKGYYRGTLQFFRDRKYEISQPKYKDKGNEFEGKIFGTLFIDMYTKSIIEIEFKSENMTPMDKDGWFKGKMFIIIEPKWQHNYDIKSPGGGGAIFEEESWLHRVYKKVVDRDLDENLWGVPVIHAHEYIEWCRAHFGMEAQDG